MYCSAKYQRGATLVEFLLVLPIFLLFASGIIEFGTALRNVEMISEASRQGARIASHFTIVGNPLGAPPVKQCASPIPQTCDSPPTTLPDCTLFPNSIECLAITETNNFLQNVLMPTNDWSVSAWVCDEEIFPASSGAPPITLQILKVRIQRAPNSRSCVLCMHQFLSSSYESSSTAFAIGGQC